MELSDLAVIVGIQLIIFLVLILLLRRIILSASASEMKRLRDLSLENERKAQKLAKEAEKAEKEYQRKVAMSDAEMKKLKSSMQEEAQAQKEEMLKQAREESEKIVKQAMSARENMRKEMQDQLRDQSIDLACSLVSEVLTQEKMKWFHDGLVKEIIDAMGELDPAHFQGINTSEPIQVHTPYELTAGDLKQLQKSIEKYVDGAVTLDQVVDKDVIAGITLTAGSLHLDGSLAGKLRQAAAGQVVGG